jgi:3-phenylpropionate/trans-cinnamate dioxygenase ferredoxin subunit
MPAELTVCPVDELPPGEVKIVRAGELAIGVYNVGGEYYAIEDRCSHDDGPLAEGDFDPERLVVICPRHGSEFDLRTGRPLSLPAYIPVDTYEVVVDDGMIKVKVA